MTELSRGIYHHLITGEIADRLQHLDPGLVQREKLDDADAHEVLARHIATLAHRALQAVPGSGDDRVTAQVHLANRIAEYIAQLQPDAVDADDQVLAAHHHRLLMAVADPPTPPAAPHFPVRPTTPLSTGALLVNGRHQPRIGHEVAHEMASADEVYLLCAFIKWNGLRQVERAVEELLARGGRLRVITTTYLGATEQRAVNRLAELGAQIRISYETRTTRLHAKAWLFRRANGASTAYVGSSNLSRTALLDGVEWNVRIANLEQDYLIDTFEATFTDYWNDPAFEEYLPDRDGERLRRALRTERSPRAGDDVTSLAGAAGELVSLDVRPYPYQQAILDDLATERLVHGRHRNLVVMATGTGKTVVAALDYRRLRAAGSVESLLFIAHQEQILRQSRSVFRHVLRDGNFGDLLVGGERPEQWRHVFASIQSLHRLGPDQLAADRFDMVIVDEFHHAEAPTYTSLLNRLTPRILVGLTATPDRADGGDVRRWFDGRTAIELHLWEALERQLLAPFQYFGLHDDVDLSQLRWRRGQGYDAGQLDGLYTGNDARARLILQAVQDKVDVGRMRALGFCVSIGHAEFMAARFARYGIQSRALTSRDDGGDRRAAIEAFRRGEVRVLFTVDLFNEGVDLPMVDTVLLLRPTESATIFLQQLGRGLRLDDGKACLTVLDFIGGQHAKFRFDLRWRALTGLPRRSVEAAVRDDFPTLPSGCHIELNRVAKQVVLDNLRAATAPGRNTLVADLRDLGDVTLAAFLAHTGLELEDIYRSPSLGGWSGLRRHAGLSATAPGPDDHVLGRAIARMLHLDDADRLDQLQHVAVGGRPAAGRIADMLHFTLWGPRVPLDERDERLARLWAHPDRCAELRQLVEALRERIPRVTVPPAMARVPLRVHARYSRDEAVAAFGMNRPDSMRQGVLWLPAEQADVFFVTVVKSTEHYSPTTLYQDRAITPELFQWESQSTTRAASPTAQRYIYHAERGSSVHLFIRETKDSDGGLGVPPYLYAGRMTYQSHSGERPMRIIWRLEHPLPAEIFHAARVAAA